MPIYEHICHCGHKVEEFRRAIDWNKVPLCPTCNVPMPQRHTTKAVRASYARPVHLESMGFLATPEDIAEHRRQFPDVELVVKEGSAIPVVRSLNQKRKYLKANNWVDTRDFH